MGILPQHLTKRDKDAIQQKLNKEKEYIIVEDNYFYHCIMARLCDPF